jgi:uncharacterized membrane protein
VGEYIVDAAKESGFIRDTRGRITTSDVPGAQGTEAYGINNRGQIVGVTLEAPAADLPGARGFLLAQGVKGPFTPVAFPGATRTAAFDINDRGQIVGAYQKPTATPSPQPGPMRLPMVMSSR